LNSDQGSPVLIIAGPCGSGKTTLVRDLARCNIKARQVAQEHSFVPDMWQKLAQPDILIFLDASFETCKFRKQFNWTEEDYKEQKRRLQHALQHSDIYIQTDGKSPLEVLEMVLEALGIGHA
jgi:ABC-type cobalamin/Fe3+-siderophores transport system ATPase subunit